MRALDDGHRLAALRTLLHDDAVDSRLRLAGWLVALYAQLAAPIVRLTAATYSSATQDSRSASDATWTPYRPSSMVSPSC